LFFLGVIPGHRAAMNPESRSGEKRIRREIPGSRLRRAPE
jgi:hypothetical protein